MNNDLFYTQSYYTLKHNIEVGDFIASLNDDELLDLIRPILKRVIDKLYTHINNIQNVIFSFEDLIEDEVEINTRLNILLSESQLYKQIKDVKITSSIFSNAIIKLCKKIFLKDGTNDETFFLEHYVVYWLEDNLANEIIKDERFKPYELIKNLIDQTEMLHRFYSSFIQVIPINWINDQSGKWCEVVQDTDEILESVRTFDKEYFKGYKEQLNNYIGFSPWRYIVETTMYSDRAMLSFEYSFKCAVLLEKNISLWIKFWDNLKLPILQDIAFFYITDPNNILRIAQDLSQNREEFVSSKQLSFILLSNLFETSLKIQDNLSFYNNESQIISLGEYESNDAILEKGKKLGVEWGSEKIILYNETIKALLQIVSIEEMSEWAFSYKPRSSVVGDYNTSYNSEIEVLIAAFTPFIISESFDNQMQYAKKNLNLQRFNFLVSQVGNTSKKEDIESLLGLVTDYTKSKKFQWDNTFSPAYWPSLKAIGKLLSYSDSPIQRAKWLIELFTVNYEGWNVPVSYEYEPVQRESFILCGSILLLEHDDAFTSIKERKRIYRYFLNYIISKTRFSVITHDNFYKQPLYLLYLVANQIYNDLKETFELEVIKYIDSVVTVIEILSADGYKLSVRSKKMLNKRIESEFNFEKRKFTQRGQTAEVVRLESLIKELDIV